MAIDFLCACGKAHSVDDSYAGKSGRCGRCRAVFDVPSYITPPDFFLDVDAETSLDPALITRPRRALGGVVYPVLAGLMIGLIAVGAGISMMKKGGDVVPAWARPPAQAVVVPAVPAPVVALAAAPAMPAPGLEFKFKPPQWLILLAMLSVPIGIPAALSRAGILSVARWGFASAFSFFMGFLMLGICQAFGPDRQYLFDVTPEAARWVAGLSGLAGIGFWIGVGGCLLAAAIYPKSRHAGPSPAA